LTAIAGLAGQREAPRPFSQIGSRNANVLGTLEGASFVAQAREFDGFLLDNLRRIFVTSALERESRIRKGIKVLYGLVDMLVNRKA
jgi:hypothetical protein